LAQDRAAVSGGLLISGNSVRQDAEGRFCLNDLHAAAGGERRHGPSLWLANQQTQGLIAELADAGIPVSTRRSGQARGTFVVRELVYAYGMWISPGFHLRVIRAFDALASQQRAQPALNLRDPKQLAAVAQQLVELNDDLRGQVEAMQVTVEAHARIADADGSACITDAAKTLQVRPKDLFAWLSEHRWIYQRPGCSGWLAYQERIQQGVLEHKVTTIPLSDGGEKVTFQVRVTAKGLARLAELISPSEPATRRRLPPPQQKSRKGARAC
jgi:phage antirepressor YoqD-like protein